MAVEPSIKKPSLFRRTVMGLVNGWRRVMDVRYNPLKYIPDPKFANIFYASIVCCVEYILGLVAANYLGWFGYNIVVSIIVHCAVLLPLAFTNAILIDAERDGHKWLKEWKEEQNRWIPVTNRLKKKELGNLESQARRRNGNIQTK